MHTDPDPEDIRRIQHIAEVRAVYDIVTAYRALPLPWNTDSAIVLPTSIAGNAGEGQQMIKLAVNTLSAAFGVTFVFSPVPGRMTVNIDAKLPSGTILRIEAWAEEAEAFLAAEAAA